tara:strand:- start:1435 stop:1914 length:480 start_codon:yes stop_codon:yes gene_type:complete
LVPFFITQFLYFILRLFSVNHSIKDYLFDMLKEDVFEIKGGCKHSGNCCHGIMLYDGQQSIDSPQHWDQFLKKFPSLHSFKPTVKFGKITAFDCTSLTCNNRCDRYQDRPSICKNYPYSFFYQHGYIYDACGYSVERNQQKYNWLLPSLKRDIQQFSSV